MTPLSEEENQQIFIGKILQDNSEQLQPSRADTPTVLYVAGQSAAGKSTTIAKAEEEMKRVHGAVLLIQRDLLRDYFPGYKAQLREHGPEGYKFSEADTWKWYEKLKTAAIERRAAVILESTFRKTTDILADVARFTQAGYRVEARVLAVHPEITKSSVFLRYEEEIANTGVGRFVDLQTQAEAIDGLQKTVSELEDQRLIEKISVRTREGKILEEAFPARDKGDAATTLVMAHGRLTEEIVAQADSNWCRVFELMEARNAPQLEMHVATREYQRMLDAAKRARAVMDKCENARRNAQNRGYRRGV